MCVYDSPVTHTEFSSMLLVSMAVLAILIGILLPALHKAVGVSAPFLRCSTNLHSLDTSMWLYLNDHRNVLPEAEFFPLRDSKFTGLDTTLDEYGGGDYTTWLCPIDPKTADESYTGGSYVYPVAISQMTNPIVNADQLPILSTLLADRGGFHRAHDIARKNSDEDDDEDDDDDITPGDRVKLEALTIDQLERLTRTRVGANHLQMNGKISIKVKSDQGNKDK